MRTTWSRSCLWCRSWRRRPAGVLVLAMLIAGAVGTFLSIREKRNLLPAAVQMQCYLGGLAAGVGRVRLVLGCCSDSLAG